MLMHYHFIINEHAASGGAKKVADLILKNIPDKTNYTLHYSNYSGHVYELIQALKPELKGFQADLEEFPLLVVIGGDGTLHEVMNALYPDSHHIPVAYIPSGSGNDFSRGIRFTRDPLKAWAQIQAVEKPQGVNLITYEEKNTGKAGVVVNNFGIGLDASIVHVTNDSASKSALNKYHMGSFSYMFSILKQLFDQKGFPVTLEINGQTHKFEKGFLCTTTNHPYFGGGVKIAPPANAYEKSFDVVLLERIPLVKIFYLIFLLTQQKHLNSPLVHHFQGNQMHLVAPEPQYAQLDGEVWEKQTYDLNFGVTTGYFWF